MKTAVPYLVDLVYRAGRTDRPPEADGVAWEAFISTHGSLVNKLRREPSAAGLLDRLLTASHELPSSDVRWTLEFISSHLVNKYQGALAELLAARELSLWLSDLVAREQIGTEITFVGGDGILERSITTRGRWLKGADGLLVVAQPDPSFVVVAGVVEIKSYGARFSQHAPQLDAHAARLRRGLRVGGLELPPDRIQLVHWTPTSGWTPDETNDSRCLLRVLVSPRMPGRGRTAALEQLPKGSHSIPLAISAAALASVAYVLTVRFLEGLGTKVFSSGSPWPEMTPEEAAINAIKENLYHLLYERRTGSRHAERIAVRLYNVYGFGYVAARDHDDMMWPVEDGTAASSLDKPPASVPAHGATMDQLIDGAWSHYRDARLPEAELWAATAMAGAPDASQRHRLCWLQGMLRFYGADFASAAALLPEPQPDESSGIWAGDVLTLAHACTRSGDLGRAEALIETLDAARLGWSHLPAALALSRAWLAWGRGDSKGCESLLAEAERELAILAAQESKRREQTLGDPPYHDPGAVALCALRAVALLAAVGRSNDALLFLANVATVFAPAAHLMQVDPALATLRAVPAQRDSLSRWLQDRRA